MCDCKTPEPVFGCGPGFLAEALLKNCEIGRYSSSTFSDAGPQWHIPDPDGFHS